MLTPFGFLIRTVGERSLSPSAAGSLVPLLSSVFSVSSMGFNCHAYNKHLLSDVLTYHSPDIQSKAHERRNPEEVT